MPAYLVAAPMSLELNSGEGSQSSRAILSFEKYMSASGCSVEVDFIQSTDAGVFTFSYAPQSIQPVDQTRYELLVQARTYSDYPLTSALVIKASTGIKDLNSAKGERLGVVSQSSYLGWQLIQELYQNVGIKLGNADIYETGGYEGSMAMLLHGDVFVAVLPGPLARRWAKSNKLYIIAESEPQDIGQLWVDKKLSAGKKQQCKSALLNLQRTTGRDKRMKIFPDWVEGFR